MSANPAADDLSAMDYPEHERTYQRFVSMVKISIVATLLVLLLLAFFTL